MCIIEIKQEEKKNEIKINRDIIRTTKQKTKNMKFNI